MNKWITVLLVVCAAAYVEAAKGDSSREEFMTAQKAQHEQKGWKWDQDKMDKLFDAIDVNGDGIASGAEKKAYWDDPSAAQAAAKARAEAKAQVEAAARAQAEAAARAQVATAAPQAKPVLLDQSKLKKGDATREMFMEVQKAQHEQKGWKWDQDKMDKMFDAIDANGDGIASIEEKKAYWNK